MGAWGAVELLVGTPVFVGAVGLVVVCRFDVGCNWGASLTEN